MAGSAEQLASTSTAAGYRRANNPFERAQLSGRCQLLPSGKAKCDECGRELWPRYIESHFRRHLDTFECAHCQRTFRSKQDLNAHIELHSSVQVVCPECGLGFPSRAVFRVHRARVHSRETSVAAHCNNNKDSRSATGQRADTSNNNERQCAVCAQWLHASSMARHMRRHNGGETGLQCSQCRKTFLNSDSLKQHAESHQSKLTLPCAHCNRWFRNKSALRHHKKLCAKSVSSGASGRTSTNAVK